MKTLSERFRFVVVGLIVVVVVVSCCNLPFPLIKDTTSCFGLGNSSVELGRLKSNQPKTTYSTYVEWKNQHGFDEALAQVLHNGGKICICVVENTGADPHRHKFNNDCSNYDCPRPEEIRTIKVTKSKAAENIASGESIANDPNVSHRVQSPNPGDIVKVLDALKK